MALPHVWFKVQVTIRVVIGQEGIGRLELNWKSRFGFLPHQLVP